MGSGNFLLLALLGLVSGASIAIQASTNAVLFQHVGKLLWVGLVLFLIGTVYLLSLIMLTKTAAPTIGQLAAAPSWAYIGGIVVASYVLTITLLVPKMGAANAIIFVVAGQILTAVLIDHFGWLGVAVREISLPRIIGVTMIIGGIYLSRRY
ncbi:DMT family transporter [Aurantivibrio plasticivorans]